MRSHHMACDEDGLLDEELLSVYSTKFKKITHDNGFRANASLEKLGNLRPAFIKPHGTITAEMPLLTAGVSASFIMDELPAL